MAGAWKILVLVLGVAGVSCFRRQRPRLRYEDVVNKAVRVYNEGQQGRPLFRLVEATPPRLNSTARIPLNFRIRETTCVSSPETRRQPQNCAFLEGGEERVCTGLFSRLRPSSLTLSCSQDCELLREGPRLRPSAEAASVGEEAEAAAAAEAGEEAEAAEAAEAGEEAEAAEAAEAGEEAEAAAAAEAGEETQSSQVPPHIRNLYEEAKYDIISNILSNF